MTTPGHDTSQDDVPTIGPEGDESSSFHDMPTSAEAFVSMETTSPIGRAFSGIREGDSVPGYTIKHVLGEGGMGAVYLAEQERPRRTVALKMIRPDRVSKMTLRRFDYEAQLLASLRHPGIAAVYEVGNFEIAGTSVPYFAMEYIAGARTLTAYAKANDLGTRERLELFLKVCEAVQHGHQQGVIHRDLKPANILVDHTGAPRIIDFGVARGNDHERAMATMRTDVGQIVGTLQYMAPEQCGTQGAADVRSDVYALGAVLFELLAGEVPYDVRELSLSEAVMVITEIPAPALSTSDARLAGDLTVIVGKALEKDRKDRYQSVSEFAADVRRYLSDQPILARPVGPIGLLRKWVKRNRELSVALAAASSLLIITSTVLIGRIVAAERRATQNLLLAERNLAASKESVELVREMLSFRDAEGESRVREGMVDVEVLLDDAAASITLSPPELPGTEAAFRELLGVGYISLRSIDKARAQLERVLEVRQAHSPSPSPELAEAMHGLARAHYWAGEFDRALPLYTKALAMRRELYPGDHPETALSLTHLAATQQRLGQLTQGERMFAEALSMRQRLHGTEHPDIAASLNNLGNLLLAKGDIDGAEIRLRQSLEIISRLKGPSDLEVSNAAHNLARVLLLKGNFAEAVELYLQAIEIRTARLKPEDGRLWASRVGLARTLFEELGADASPEDVAALAAELDATTEHRAAALESLGERLLALGRWRDAGAVLESSIVATRLLRPVPGDRLADRLVARARAATGIEDFPVAESLLAEARTLLHDGADADRYARAVSALVERLESLGMDEAAERCVSVLSIR